MGETDMKQISEDFPRGTDFIWKKVRKVAILFKIPNIQQKHTICVKHKQTESKELCHTHMKKKAGNRNYV